MKVFSYFQNIKFNARPDGTLRYEKTTTLTTDLPLVDSVVESAAKLVTCLARIYRIIRSKFSA